MKDVYVAPCDAQPLFKKRFLNPCVDLPCKCLLQGKGQCTNCKARCFALNFVVNKLNFYLNLCLKIFSEKQLMIIQKKTLKVCFFETFAKSA